MIHDHESRHHVEFEKTLNGRIRRVGHIEVFQVKFAEGLGNSLVTLSAKFHSDRMQRKFLQIFF